MDINSTLPRSTKEARLLNMLSYYRPIEILHSTVEEMCTSSVFNEHFQKILQHDLRTIKRRSQDLDDHEISLAQKAFVILMDEGDHIAGIEIYVEEIIGLRDADDEDRMQILKSSVKTKDLIVMSTQHSKTESHSNQEPRSPPFHGYSSSVRARNERQASEELFVSEGSQHENPGEQQQHQNMAPGAAEDQSVTDIPGDRGLMYPEQDPKFERLWTLYKTANDEYCKTRKNSMNRTRAAKFLRDTTENCIFYIEDKQTASRSQMHDKSKLGELRAALENSIKEVEKGSGGRKRRFDDDWDDVPIAPRQLMGNHPVELALDQDKREPPLKTLPPHRGSYSYRYEGPKTARTSRYKEERLSQFHRQRLAALVHDARGPPMKALPPLPGSYSQSRPMTTSDNRYSEQYPSQFNRRRSVSPGPNAPKAPRNLPPPHDSYGGPGAASPSRYHEQRLNQINRRRSASPASYPDAPLQVSMSEQSRDRRRQDLLPGYYDTYRPHY